MRSLVLAAFVGILVLSSTSARAVGRLVDVAVVDRDTGETLTPVAWRGEWWIAGRPGARYAVTLANRSGQRTLGVLSIDGVNAITGDTASWSQSGYVLAPYEQNRIAGWRKSTETVAAFEFTALPDSYAAQTGRPANVGVIGVAVFSERRRVAPPAISAPPRAPLPAPAAEAPEPAPSGASADASSRLAFAPRERLGTGHGAIEDSAIRYVAFERLQDTPNEVVTIRYDRVENLIAMGILPRPSAAPAPVRPFPGSERFAPDPPTRR